MLFSGFVLLSLGCTPPPSTVFSRKIATAFIYAMNVSEEVMKEYQYPVHFGMNENYLTRMFGQAETLSAFETLQFEDYNKVVFQYFDPEARKQLRLNVFPEDCRKASELGALLVSSVSQP